MFRWTLPLLTRDMRQVPAWFMHGPDATTSANICYENGCTWFPHLGQMRWSTTPKLKQSMIGQTKMQKRKRVCVADWAGNSFSMHFPVWKVLHATVFETDRQKDKKMGSLFVDGQAEEVRKYWHLWLFVYSATIMSWHGGAWSCVVIMNAREPWMSGHMDGLFGSQLHQALEWLYVPLTSLVFSNVHVSLTFSVSRPYPEPLCSVLQRTW